VSDPSAVAVPLLDRVSLSSVVRPWTRPLRVVDVAMFYGERSGGIRTYLEAKAEFAARTGRLEHHLVVPGRTTTSDGSGRHEQRSLRLAASNGYRVPLGGTGVANTLRGLAPDAVLLHDPFWTLRLAARAAHECGALVIAVHHSSAALHAAGLPGPHTFYAGALRRWYRRAYLDVDAVMSVVDTCPPGHRWPSWPCPGSRSTSGVGWSRSICCTRAGTWPRAGSPRCRWTSPRSTRALPCGAAGEARRG
jgi:hypothetical protein